MKNVTIVCDGSSLGNGRGVTRAAAVAILGFKGYWKAVGEYLGNATNQQAEIAAAAIGLENLKEACKVTVMSDSRYVVETTKGHAGHKVQEIADKTARRMAELGKVDPALLEEAVVDIGVEEL